MNITISLGYWGLCALRWIVFKKWIVSRIKTIHLPFPTVNNAQTEWNKRDSLSMQTYTCDQWPFCMESFSLCIFTWWEAMFAFKYQRLMATMYSEELLWSMHEWLSLIVSLSYRRTHSMEQSPSWEVNSHSASQEILHLLWNMKVHYCVHKGPPLVPTLSQMHPLSRSFQRIHPNPRPCVTFCNKLVHLWWGVTSLCNPRVCHAVVTDSHNMVHIDRFPN